jgi:hypothetical protein
VRKRGLMVGSKRILIPFGLLLILAATALPAQANHWCGQSSITMAPSNPVATHATTFTITVANTGVDTTQLSAVQAKFSWEGTWHDAGSGTILAGQSKTFTTSATPPSAGAYQVDMKVTGTSSGDVLHESSDCTATTSLTAVAASPGLDGGLVAIAIAAAAVVMVARRRGSEGQ